jgi:hypothetical protein
MKTKPHFAFRIDVWDDGDANLVEHLAGLDDYAMAVAAYWETVRGDQLWCHCNTPKTFK